MQIGDRIDLDGEFEPDDPMTRHNLCRELAELLGWKKFEHDTDGLSWSTWTHPRMGRARDSWQLPRWWGNEASMWERRTFPGPDAGHAEALDFFTWPWAGWVLEEMNRLGWSCRLEYPTDPPWEVICIMSTGLTDHPGDGCVSVEWWVDAPGRTGAPMAIGLCALHALRKWREKEATFNRKDLKIPQKSQTDQEKPKMGSRCPECYGGAALAGGQTCPACGLHRELIDPLDGKPVVPDADLPAYRHQREFGNHADLYTRASVCSACGGGSYLEKGATCSLCGYQHPARPEPQNL